MIIQPEVEANRSMSNAWDLTVGSDICKNVQAGLFVGWIPLAVGILLFVLAWGLWRLASWAYFTTLILEVPNILLNLFELGQPNHSIFGILGGGLLSVIIVIYLLVDRHVREAFRF